MNALSAITSAGTTLFAQGLPAVMNASNSMSTITGAFSQLGGRGAFGAPGARGPAPTLKYSDATPLTDPAYVAAPLLAPFITTLYTYLTCGPDQTPDWSKFNGSPAATGSGTEGLTWLLSNLKMQQKEAQLSDSGPSSVLRSVFETTIATVEEVKVEALARTQKLNSTATAATFKKWHGAVLAAKEKVTQLDTAAKSFPGASPNVPKLKHVSMTPDKSDNSGVTAALSTATEKLALNQKALEVAQANYSKAVENAAEVQKRLTTIQTKFKGLKIAGAALERVREVLIECIVVLVEFKVQISKLTTFFSALSTMIKVIIDTNVNNFDSDRAVVGQHAANTGLLKLNSLDIETIYISTLQIKAYFDLLQMICQMYTSIHADHINPGLDLLTELSRTRTADDIGPKRDVLNTLTEEASKAINDLVRDVSLTYNKCIDASGQLCRHFLPKFYISFAQFDYKMANLALANRNNKKSPIACNLVSTLLLSRQIFSTRPVYPCLLQVSLRP